MNYGNYLRDMTKKFQGKFIDYDVYTGTWTFKVEHFWYCFVYLAYGQHFVYCRKKKIKKTTFVIMLYSDK